MRRIGRMLEQLELIFSGPPRRVSRATPAMFLFLHPLDPPHPLEPFVLDASRAALTPANVEARRRPVHTETQRTTEGAETEPPHGGIIANPK